MSYRSYMSYTAHLHIFGKLELYPIDELAHELSGVCNFCALVRSATTQPIGPVHFRHTASAVDLLSTLNGYIVIGPIFGAGVTPPSWLFSPPSWRGQWEQYPKFPIFMAHRAKGPA